MSVFETNLTGDREWTRVGDFYEVTRKPRALDRSSINAVPFAAMDAIPQGGAYDPRFTLKAPSTITSGTYFERGDILVAKITPSFENGKQALARNLNEPFGYATTEVIPLRPKDARHDPRLLFFYLLHPDVRHYLAERMEGTTGRQRVPENVLLDLPMPALDHDEQTAIANALEAVQQATVLENQCESTTRDLRRAAMRALFTRGLRGEEQKDTEIGRVPSSWTLTPCERIFKLTSGKTRPSDLAANPSSENSFPVIGGNGVMGFSSKWNVDADRILSIGRVGEYCGVVHLSSGKSWITDNALYSKEWLLDTADLTFVGKFLEHFNLNRFKRMAGQPLVTQGMINEHSIPLPSPEEQHEIVSILDSIDAKIEFHHRKHRVLNDLFTALLHKLITGEVRVADLNLSALDPIKPAEGAA